MPLRMSSSVTLPSAIMRMPALSRPRSANCFISAEPAPEGTKVNSASGLASRTFCRKGAKSGPRRGTRSDSTTTPPLAWKRWLKYFSESTPGA
ncbi:hypothetical protein D9M69_614230 [compost metagenome]